MTADELIRSGLLEAYVLGQCTPQEASLVEGIRTSDPSVRAEMDAIEFALEQQAVQQSVAPAPGAKANIMARIAQEPRMKEIPVIPITAERKSFNWLAAASVAALFISAGVNYMQYRELRAVRTELADLQQENSVFAQELQVQRTSLQHSQEQIALLKDPRMLPVLLNGMGTAAGSSSRVYWDRTAGVVFFDQLSLPAIAEGNQYQLWALVDGKPVDAGMVPLDSTGLARMKDIPNAQAFAVTIEKLGGSPTPHLEALVLLGNV